MKAPDQDAQTVRLIVRVKCPGFTWKGWGTHGDKKRHIAVGAETGPFAALFASQEDILWGAYGLCAGLNVA
jgi:hypothetical protein